MFSLVLTQSITIPAERQRKDLGDIDTLAESIRRLGLINPITVTRDLVLIAGERRLTACRQLGFDQIPVRFYEDLDELTRHLIELEENIKRKDITWQEECEAVAAYHRVQSEANPEWTIIETAEAIGVSRKFVSDRLMIEEEVKLRPQIKELPKLSEAVTASLRQRSRRDGEVLKKVEASILKPVLEGKKEEAPKSIIVADFNQWAPTYSGPLFNFIHCDFPYGINIQASDQANSSEIGSYDDTPETYWKLMQTFCDNLDRIAAQSCHLMFWFSMTHYQQTLEMLRSTDFVVNPFPLVWLKSDNAGIMPDARRGPRRIYETAFIASRGDRFIAQSASNAYAAPSSRNIHLSEKSEPMLRYFFQMFVDKHTIMLDPTAGSGSAIRAAESLDAGFVQGLELNPEYARLANESIEIARRKRKAGND